MQFFYFLKEDDISLQYVLPTNIELVTIYSLLLFSLFLDKASYSKGDSFE